MNRVKLETSDYGMHSLTCFGWNKKSVVEVVFYCTLRCVLRLWCGLKKKNFIYVLIHKAQTKDIYHMSMIHFLFLLVSCHILHLYGKSFALLQKDLQVRKKTLMELKSYFFPNVATMCAHVSVFQCVLLSILHPSFSTLFASPGWKLHPQ